LGRWISLALDRSRELLRTSGEDRRVHLLLVVLLTIDLSATLWWGATRLLYNLEIDSSLYHLKSLRIDVDGGLPERFSYAKTLLLVILIGYLLLARRQWIYASLAALFTLVLADDMLGIHEAGGKFFARALDLQPMYGMRAVDFGEVITWLLLGILIAPLLAFGLLRSARPDRANGLTLLTPFVALVFCGVVVDQLFHVMRDAFFGVDVMLGMIEDGGEMVAITAACVLAAAMVRETETASPG
jgi:hypothetical protein